MVRFPSGQREQTVNLPAQPSEVRILPSPDANKVLDIVELTYYFEQNRLFCAGVTQLVESQPSKLLVAGSSPVSRLNWRNG